MWFNSEPTKIEQWNVNKVIYIYNEPRAFPNVQLWLHNVATITEFFDNRRVIFF